MKITRILPLSYISWCLGALARLPLPQPLARLSILIFAGIYKIDPHQATKPLKAFRCIGEFFIRDLKPELRPIEGDVVSPVDARVRGAHPVPERGVIPQVKDKCYSLEALLGDGERARQFLNGYFWNFYLSPSDVHHIYAPVSGEIVQTVHIPGKLWPVNDWALESVDSLFAVNERIITFMESEYGTFAIVMVGATNVGSISLSYDTIITNRYPWQKRALHGVNYPKPISIAAGEKLGTFNMGSSVILLTEKTIPNVRTLDVGQMISYGERLLEVSSTC